MKWLPLVVIIVASITAAIFLFSSTPAPQPQTPQVVTSPEPTGHPDAILPREDDEANEADLPNPDPRILDKDDEDALAHPPTDEGAQGYPAPDQAGEPRGD